MTQERAAGGLEQQLSAIHQSTPSQQLGISRRDKLVLRLASPLAMAGHRRYGQPRAMP